jgi:hypothetical protein
VEVGGAQAEEIDLEEAEVSTSYLSHWMTVRSGMVAFSIGHEVSATGSWPSRKPPGWIDEVAREVGSHGPAR